MVKITAISAIRLPSQIAPSCVESHHVYRSFDAAGGATPGESPSDVRWMGLLPASPKKTMGSVGKPWENHGKIIGKWRYIWYFIEIYGEFAMEIYENMWNI